MTAAAQTALPRAELSRRTLGFAAILGASAAFFWPHLATLAHLSLSDDTYSHILLVPMLSAGLLWMNRKAFFARPGTSPGWAAAMFLAGCLVYLLRARANLLAGAALLTITIFSLVLVVWAGFLLCYGRGTFGAALFPMMFLLLAVPIPVPFVERLIFWLQQGSSEVTYWLFRATGTPVLRNGFVFAVPGQVIEVAQECSGIRSSIAMLITCLLGGFLFLRSNWARIVLLLAAVPMLVIKNGIRIVTLTLLSIHVDPGFLRGKLHQRGGFAFFLLGLLILWPLLLWLQRIEAKSRATTEGAASTARAALAPRVS